MAGQFRILHVRKRGDLQESPVTAKVFLLVWYVARMGRPIGRQRSGKESLERTRRWVIINIYIPRRTHQLILKFTHLSVTS